MKGHCDPYAKAYDAWEPRVLIFPPTMLDDYELDPGCVLLAMAWRRGSFPHDSLAAVLGSSEIPIRTKPDKASQAVFLGSNQIQSLTDKPLRAAVINSKLKSACHEVGLTGPNSFYGFRRGRTSRIAEVFGYDKARAVLGHAAGSSTIDHYVTKPTDTLDLTNLTKLDLVGLRRTVDDREQRRDKLPPDLKRQINQTVRARLQLDAESIENDKTLFSHVSQVAAGLEEDIAMDKLAIWRCEQGLRAKGDAAAQSQLLGLRAEHERQEQVRRKLRRRHKRQYLKKTR